MNVDELFRKPNLPSSSANGKRKFEASDAQAAYKAAKLSPNGDVKHNGASVEDEPEDDIEAGPELPPEDEDADEEGRFFGGGVTRDTANALDYLDQADEEAYVEEKIDAAWVRRLGINFERKINKNAELRAKFESDASKFMASEADLDAQLKELSILTEHPELYPEFARIGCTASLVSLLAHENTDVAIDAIEIVAELLDEDVAAEQEHWDALVDAMLEADLVNLLRSNLDRFDESNEVDRSGVYHSLAVLEGLASQSTVAEKVGEKEVLEWLMKRCRAKESPFSQNKQYAAEVLGILLQSSATIRKRFISELEGVDFFLQLLAAYRKRDPEKDSAEEEFAENLFDGLTCVVDEQEGKAALVQFEGVELALIMLKEGKMSKTRALRVLDHAMSGSGLEVCNQVVESAGLKTIFGMFMKKLDNESTEHLLGIFSALLRLLPGESAPRIRTLAKFVEKEYEKVDKLIKLRRDYAARIAAVDEEIRAEQKVLEPAEREERSDEWFSRRLDAGLYCLQTLDVILAWLVAEDGGARKRVAQLLAERDEKLDVLKASLEELLDGVEGSEEGQNQDTGEMLKALLECL
ncbi:hypothetical protein M8818_005118 [Zalaria obscura]|uniref:Uncharacterized protein n=1 Tax=Zalaria obscura TaxID=2024903 RepID=A0ACC3S9T2_9PEZI